jgi:hypothetical protein
LLCHQALIDADIRCILLDPLCILDNHGLMCGHYAAIAHVDKVLIGLAAGHTLSRIGELLFVLGPQKVQNLLSSQGKVTGWRLGKG